MRPQVIDQIELAIAAGLFTSGVRMPVARTLADDLGVSPLTVGKPYTELARRGVAEHPARLGLASSVKSSAARTRVAAIVSSVVVAVVAVVAFVALVGWPAMSRTDRAVDANRASASTARRESGAGVDGALARVPCISQRVRPLIFSASLEDGSPVELAIDEPELIGAPLWVEARVDGYPLLPHAPFELAEDVDLSDADPVSGVSRVVWIAPKPEGGATGNVKVRVEDSSGAPKAGAWVRTSAYGVHRARTTGDDGVCRFEGVPIGLSHFELELGELAPLRGFVVGGLVKVEVDGEHVVVLGAPRETAAALARVVDPERAPLAGIIVTIDGLRRYASVSDSQGMARFDAVMPGGYQIAIRERSDGVT